MLIISVVPFLASLVLTALSTSSRTPGTMFKLLKNLFTTTWYGSFKVPKARESATFT